MLLSLRCNFRVGSPAFKRGLQAHLSQSLT
jgi:hypothetical protein